MAALIDQLTETLKQRDGIEAAEARFFALKEIVLSGLSRAGFFRENPYVPEMDSITENCLYLTCLGSAERRDAAFSFLG